MNFNWKKPTPFELSEVTVLTDCGGGWLCTVVEEAVFSTLLREGKVDWDTLY
jgi:hypothetical protein